MPSHSCIFFHFLVDFPFLWKTGYSIACTTCEFTNMEGNKQVKWKFCNFTINTDNIAIKSIKTRVAIYTYRFSSGNFDPYCISFQHNVLGLNYKVTFRCIWDTSWSYLTFVLIAASVVFDTHLEPAQGMEQMIWLFIKLLCNNDHTMCATSQMQDIIKMCFRCYNVCWTLPLIGS